MIDTSKYEGHTPADDWETHLVDALFETEFPMTHADNQLMADAPLLLAEVKRLRKDRDLLWDAIRLSGTGCWREEEIAFWHEKLLNMNEAELKEAFKEHYEDD